MPSLLSIDISTHTGWAYWRDTSKPPVCGTERLPKVHDQEDYGTRTWALMQWLDQFIEDYGTPDAIALESPFIPMGMNNGKSATFNTTAQTIRLQISLASTIELVAKSHMIRCLEVATQSAKVALIGFGHRPKDKPKWDWKKEMLIAATRAGYRVANDHEADAIAVGNVAAEHLWGIEV